VSRGRQVDADLGRLNGEGVDSEDRFDLDFGSNETGEMDAKTVANDSGVVHQGTLSMTEPGTMFEALTVEDKNSNLDDEVDDNETEMGEPDDTDTFRMRMVKFMKKFQLLLDEGFCSGVDPDLCEAVQRDLDEIFEEFVW
jgi:hypothetical protein